MIRAAECPAPDHVGRQAGGDTCFPLRQDSPAVAAPAGPIARRPRIAAPSALHTVRSSTAFAPGPRRDSLRRRRVGRRPALSSCRCRRQADIAVLRIPTARAPESLNANLARQVLGLAISARGEAVAGTGRRDGRSRLASGQGGPVVCQRGDQVRGLPFLSWAPRTVLPSMAITSRPPARAAPVCSQAPGPVEHVGADQVERAAEGGLLRRAPGRAQHGQRLRAGIGGALPDRGERPRPRDHRRDPHGQQPRQRMTAAAPLPRVRDLGQEIEQVLAAGSRHRRRCHRRAGVPSRQKMVSVNSVTAVGAYRRGQQVTGVVIGRGRAGSGQQLAAKPRPAAPAAVAQRPVPDRAVGAADEHAELAPGAVGGRHRGLGGQPPAQRLPGCPAAGGPLVPPPLTPDAGTPPPVPPVGSPPPAAARILAGCFVLMVALGLRASSPTADQLVFGDAVLGEKARCVAVLDRVG